MFCKHQGCEIEWGLIFNIKLFKLFSVRFYVFSCFPNCEAFQVKLDQESEIRRSLWSNFPLSLTEESLVATAGLRIRCH